MGGEKGKVFDGPNLQLPDVRGYGLRMSLTWLSDLWALGEQFSAGKWLSFLFSTYGVCVCEKKMRKEG